MQAFSQSSESFDFPKADSANSPNKDLTTSEVLLLSAAGLMTPETDANSKETSPPLSSNGLDILPSAGSSGHGSAALTPSPRPAGGLDDPAVTAAVVAAVTSSGLMQQASDSGVSNCSSEEALKRQNLLLAQQLAAAGFPSGGSSQMQGVQLQLALQAALAAGGMNYSNGNNSNSFGGKLLDLDVNSASQSRGQHSPKMPTTSANDVNRAFADALAASGVSRNQMKDDDLKQNMLNNSGPWSAQIEELFPGFSNNSNANSKRAITGQHSYMQPQSNPQQSAAFAAAAALSSRPNSGFPNMQQQSQSSKMSGGWSGGGGNAGNGGNSGNSKSGGWPSLSPNSAASSNGVSGSGHMNPWSQALQYQRLGLGHTPMNAFPNMPKNAGGQMGGGMGNGVFGNQGSRGNDRMKRSPQPFVPSQLNNSHSPFKMDHSSSGNNSNAANELADWQHGLNMLQQQNESMSGTGGSSLMKGQVSPLDNLRCLENPLLEIMKNNGAGGMGDLQGGQIDENILASLDPSLASLAQGHNLPTDLFNLGREERYSRKVFVGGLPPDIDEDEITTAFRRFGNLIVDWPHKQESKSFFPPKGYCFLLFQDELSVQGLIDSCIMDDNKFYWCVSSPTMKDKPVQIRPWNLNDSDYVHDGSQPLDPRKTIFVGGVPRPLRAVELAMIMDRLYGGVCYAGIDTDPELKYPKGAGRVAFSNQQSYIAAISARFVQLQHGDIDKRVEVKPYVLDDQMCDECNGSRCAGKFAPFFCANVTCLQYYCEQCWAQIHSRPGREYHKPLVKEGADRPRTVPFRW